MDYSMYGDKSFPKVQYPTKANAPEVFTPDSKYDEEKVIQFFRNLYKQENVAPITL